MAPLSPQEHLEFHVLIEWTIQKSHEGLMNKVRSEILRVSSSLFNEPKMIILVQKLEAMLCLGCLKTAIIKDDHKPIRTIFWCVKCFRLRVFGFFHHLWFNLFKVRETLSVRAGISLIFEVLLDLFLDFVLCFHFNFI